MKKILLLILILFNGLIVFGQKPAWFIKLEKLQNFYSTETDVNNLFKSIKVTYSTTIDEIKKSKAKTKVIEYEIPEGKLSVFYSAGKCSVENTKGFDLDDGVIIDFKFWLDDPLAVSSLKLNLKNYSLSRQNDVEILFFTNKEKGITYIIDGNEKLRGIEYSLPKKYLQDCENLI